MSKNCGVIEKSFEGFKGSDQVEIQVRIIGKVLNDACHFEIAKIIQVEPFPYRTVVAETFFGGVPATSSCLLW